MPELFDGSKTTSPEPVTQKLELAPDIAPSPDLSSDSDSTHSSAGSQEQLKSHTNDPNEYSKMLCAEKPTTNPFQAFLAKPRKMFFDSQASAEQILLILRRHPATQIPWIVTAVIFAVLPYWFVSLPVVSTLPANYLLASFIGWYLLLTGFILESFLSWFFNVYIVTDERIIDVDFVSLIYKNVSFAKIDKIEDVTVQTGGVLQAVFNYGSVFIQTAAEKREFDFADVPQPAKVSQLLNELIIQEEQEQLEGRVS
jgi:hypothetical protein